MSLNSSFARFKKKVVGFRHALFAETVTIGTWTGSAEVTDPTLETDFVSGGKYLKAQLVVLVQKADLPTGFTPTLQMDVVARGLLLRIAPDGIKNNLGSWRLVLVARKAPR